MIMKISATRSRSRVAVASFRNATVATSIFEAIFKDAEQKQIEAALTVAKRHEHLQATIGLNDNQMDDLEQRQLMIGEDYEEVEYLPREKRKDIDIGSVALYVPRRASRYEAIANAADPRVSAYDRISHRMKLEKKSLVKNRASVSVTEERKEKKMQFEFFHDFELLLEREMNQQQDTIQEVGRSDVVVQTSLTGKLNINDAVDMVAHLMNHLYNEAVPMSPEDAEYVYLIVSNVLFTKMNIIWVHWKIFKLGWMNGIRKSSSA